MDRPDLMNDAQRYALWRSEKLPGAWRRWQIRLLIAEEVWLVGV